MAEAGKLLYKTHPMPERLGGSKFGICPLSALSPLARRSVQSTLGSAQNATLQMIRQSPGTTAPTPLQNTVIHHPSNTP